MARWVNFVDFFVGGMPISSISPLICDPTWFFHFLSKDFPLVLTTLSYFYPISWVALLLTYIPFNISKPNLPSLTNFSPFVSISKVFIVLSKLLTILSNFGSLFPFFWILSDVFLDLLTPLCKFISCFSTLFDPLPPTKIPSDSCPHDPLDQPPSSWRTRPSIFWVISFFLCAPIAILNNWL